MYRIDDWRLSCSIHQLSLPLVIFPISNIIPCSGRNGRFLLELEVLLLSTDFSIEILILRKTKKIGKKTHWLFHGDPFDTWAFPPELPLPIHRIPHRLCPFDFVIHSF